MSSLSALRKTAVVDLPEEARDAALTGFQDRVPGSQLPKESALPNQTHRRTVGVKGFVKGFEKVARRQFQSGARAIKAPAGGNGLYKALEYGGLGALAALDIHEAYKAHKHKDTGARNKALIGTAALGALMGATALAKH